MRKFCLRKNGLRKNGSCARRSPLLNSSLILFAVARTVLATAHQAFRGIIGVERNLILLDPQQLNSYSYVRNNPVNLVDPTGNVSIKALAKAVASKVGSWFKTKTAEAPAPSATDMPIQKTTTWDSLTDKRIKQLDPRVQQSATNFINNTESTLGIQLRITESYRTGAQQNLYYARGRTQEKLNLVGLNNVKARPDLPHNTDAIAGKSYHNYGRALDAVIMENGNPNWSKPITPEIANVGSQQGFVWGGSFKDYPHFEMSLGQSVGQLYKTYSYDQ